MKKIVYAVLAFAPGLALAQNPNFTGLNSIVTFIKDTVRALIPVFFGLAIIYFFWGLIEYIRSAGDPKKAAEGRTIMIYGVIAIAIMISIYGLTAWLQGVFGINANATANIPVVNGL